MSRNYKQLSPLLVSVLALHACLAAKTNELPSDFPRCHLSNPDYDKCHMNAVQSAFRLLKNGLPSLKILPIDPLQVSEMTMAQSSGGSVAISLSLQDVKINGFSGIQYNSASDGIRYGNFNMWSDTRVPELSMISQYKIDGRILILPITGQGRSNVTMKNIRVLSSLENEKVTRGGEDYIRCNKFVVKIQPEKIYFDFENLFGGDDRLGREMNVFLNQNSNLVFGELSPAIEETFGEIFKQVSNQILLKVPYKTMFLGD